MEKENKVCFKIYGRYALFTNPATRLGGEKFSYQVPTYEALKGALKSVYWKPTFDWVIDRCRVMKPIQTETKGMRPIIYKIEKTDLSYYTYLFDVEYQVEAHFEWDMSKEELAQDRNENKHWLIAKRMIERGGRRDVFLGTRECQAYVEPCEFMEDKGAYDDIEELSLGLMFHGYTYPSDASDTEIKARFAHIVMKKGIIEFPTPQECSLIRHGGTSDYKEFVLGKNIKVEEEVNDDELAT